jgi:hypothetical protein
MLPYAALSSFLIPIQGAISIAVIIVFIPSFIQKLIEDKFTPGSALNIGIVLAWVAVAGHGFWSVIGEAYGFTINTEKSQITGFLSWIASSAAIWHIIGPGIKDNRVPMQNWLAVLIAVGLGCLVAGATITWMFLRG